MYQILKQAFGDELWIRPIPVRGLHVSQMVKTVKKCSECPLTTITDINAGKVWGSIMTCQILSQN